MRLRWDEHCRLPVTLRQLLARGQGAASQTQTRCIVNIQRPKQTLDIRAVPDNRKDGSAACTVAVKAQNAGCKELTFSAPQSSYRKHLEAATNGHTQHDPRDDAKPKLGGGGVVNAEDRSSLRDVLSYVEKKKSRFANQEKGKENRLLVNQLIRDRGHLSYDWRVVLELLEQNCEIPKAQTPSTSESPFPKVVPSYDTGGQHQSSRPIQRILYHNPQEARLARDISRPAVWSETILSGYIEDLVESQYHRDSIARKPQLQNKRSSNLTDITSALSEVLHSQSTKRYLSIQAYKTALRFYCDHGFLSKARELYIQMENSGMKIPTEIFNLLLRGSASAKDLHNFTFILQKSIQRGFKPDIETWNAFLITINSSQVRAVIVRRMWGRGIFHALPRKGNNMRLIIQQEVGSYVDERGDRGAFLCHMDDRYGNDWMSTCTGNKLLYEFGKRKTIPETLCLLSGMKLRGWRPDEISLDTLLRQSLLLRQHKHAVEILQSFRHHFGMRPGKMAHETLFLLACRSRLLNFARVVWASACVCGHTTFKIRNFVFHSLLSSYEAVQPSDGRSERFQKLAGKFVVGVHSSKKAVPPGSGEDPEAQGPVSRRSIVRSSRMLLQSDYFAAWSPFIQENLEELLLRAMELDMKWAATKFLTAADFDQVFQERIRIQRAVPSGQQRRLRFRRLSARKPQKARALRLTSNSVQEQAPSFYKTQVFRFRRARASKSCRHVLSPEPNAPRPRHVCISSHIAREAHHAKSRDGVDPSIRDYSIRSNFRRPVDGRGQWKPSLRLTTGKKSVGSAGNKPAMPLTDSDPLLPSEQSFRPVATTSLRKELSSQGVFRKVASELSSCQILRSGHSLLDGAVLPDLPKQVVESVPPQASTMLTKGQEHGNPHCPSLSRELHIELPSPTTVSNKPMGHIVGGLKTDSATHINQQWRKRGNLKVLRPLVASNIPIFPSDFAVKRPSIRLVSQDPHWHVKRQISAVPSAQIFSSGPISLRSSSDPSTCVSREEGVTPLTSAPRTVQKLPTSTPTNRSKRPMAPRPTDGRIQHKPAANDLARSRTIKYATQNPVGDHSEERTTGPYAIRMIPIGENATKSSTGSNLLKPRVLSMVRKMSLDIERQGLARPLVRKHPVKIVEQAPAARPSIRKHLFGAAGNPQHPRAAAGEPLLHLADKHSAPPAPVRNLPSTKDPTSGPQVPIRKHAYNKQPAACAPAEKPLLYLTGNHSEPPAPVRNPPAGKDFTSRPRVPIRKYTTEKPLINPAEKHPAPTAPARSPSANLVRKDYTSRPRVIIRNHDTVVYNKHPADSVSRVQSADSEGATLPASVETAQIHSSLDEVLRLSGALVKDAKLAGLEEGTAGRITVRRVNGTRQLKGL